MRRRLFNFAAGVSLLMCVATAALWVRSYAYMDYLLVNTGPAFALPISLNGKLLVRLGTRFSGPAPKVGLTTLPLATRDDQQARDLARDDTPCHACGFGCNLISLTYPGNPGGARRPDAPARRGPPGLVSPRRVAAAADVAPPPAAGRPRPCSSGDHPVRHLRLRPPRHAAGGALPGVRGGTEMRKSESSPAATAERGRGFWVCRCRFREAGAAGRFAICNLQLAINRVEAFVFSIANCLF